MTIFFDFDLERLITAVNMSLTGHAKLIVEEIEPFIISRLAVLKDQIDTEPNGFIVVNIADEEGNPHIYYNNYSEELALRMRNSISESDYLFITTKVYYLISQQ